MIRASGRRGAFTREQRESGMPCISATGWGPQGHQRRQQRCHLRRTVFADTTAVKWFSRSPKWTTKASFLSELPFGAGGQ